MAQKPANIDDIKKPGGVTPSSSARPILVTDRPTMATDPMIATDAPKVVAESTHPMSHNAKVIRPLALGEDASEEALAKKKKEVTSEISSETESEPEAPAKVAAEVTAETAELKPGTTSATSDEPKKADYAETETSEADDKSDIPETPHRDSEAEVTAAEAAAIEAQVARESELEELIEKGTYAVPINAAHRQRMHLLTVLLWMFTLIVLAVVVVDAALDAGLIEISGVPHTDLLKDK